MSGHRIRPLAGEWCFKALSGDGFPRVLGSLLNRLQLFRDWNSPLHQSLCFPTAEQRRILSACIHPWLSIFLTPMSWEQAPPTPLFVDREPPSWLQSNHLRWPRTHSVLMLLQTPRIFRTSYFLPQTLFLFLAFWFLEISIKLNFLYPRTHVGCEGTSSLSSAFFSRNIQFLPMFPKGFVVCGFHVITPTNEGIDHTKTTAINLCDSNNNM